MAKPPHLRLKGKGRDAKERIQASGLTLLQEAYCREYVVDEDQRGAAVRAGYAPGSASVKASQNMANPLITARIDALRKERNERTLMTGADLLRYAQTALLTCFTDHFTPGPGGRWVITRDGYQRLPVEVKRLIEEMEVRRYHNDKTGETEETLQVRFVSKSAMVMFLGKYMLTEKHQSTNVNLDVAGILAAISGIPTDEKPPRVQQVPVSFTTTEVNALLEKAGINPRPKD